MKRLEEQLIANSRLSQTGEAASFMKVEPIPSQDGPVQVRSSYAHYFVLNSEGTIAGVECFALVVSY